MAVSSVSRPAFQARSRIAAASDRLTCPVSFAIRSEEHTSELQSQSKLVCRLLLEKKKLATRAFEHVVGRVGHRAKTPALDQDRFLVNNFRRLHHLAVGGGHHGVRPTLAVQLSAHQ